MNNAYVVAGLGFGDEGKGTITDYLVRLHGAKLVVRTGGPQAAHNVITAEGVHHQFSQFGSGTLAGADTHLSEFMLVDPPALLAEARVLARKTGIRNPLKRLSISPEAVIVTPFHVLANQIRESFRGDERHGSVGRGIGETRCDMENGLMLKVKDLNHSLDCWRILHEIKMRKLAAFGHLDNEYVSRLKAINCLLLRDEYQESFRQQVTVRETLSVLDQASTVVFEGSQGVLLDEVYGFAPHNTWLDTTFKSACTLAYEAGCHEAYIERVGVLRSYHTRHGAGPFPTEDPTLPGVDEPHNQPHAWMGSFRTGYFDMVLAKYAVAVSKPDVLAVTHMDRRPSEMVAVEYDTGDIRSLSNMEPVTRQLWESRPYYQRIPDLLPAIEEECGVPVEYTSSGPRSDQKTATADAVAQAA